MTTPEGERARRLAACKTSAAVQLIVLIAVFIALPILFYGVVRAWDAERAFAREELTATRISLVARAIAPALEQATPAVAGELENTLARFAGKDLNLTLFFRPPASTPTPGVFFIAGAPALGAAALKAETDRLRNAQIFARLIERCDQTGTDDSAAAHDRHTRTIVTRVRGAHGCWGLVAVARAQAAATLWSHPALRITGFAYGALVLLALASATRLLVTLNRAGEHERDRGEPPALETAAPVLTAPVVAPEAPKPSNDPPSLHAPGLLDAARESLDLSRVVREYLESQRQKLGDARERIVDDIRNGIIIRGREDFVGTILDELIGEPLSEGASVNVALTVTNDDIRRRALLTVSLQRMPAASAEIGRLPQIKQFVAALGAVSAETRDHEGVTVRIALQA